MGQAAHFRSNGHNAEISQMTISKEMGQLSYLHTEGYTTAMEMTDVQLQAQEHMVGDRRVNTLSPSMYSALCSV